MTKVFINIVIYLVFVAVGCILLGFFHIPVPSVLPTDIISYKINSGVLVFLEVFPSAVIAVFIMACAIYYGKGKTGFKSRFSPTIYKKYRELMISSILVTLVITLCTLVFRPMAAEKKARMESAPFILNEYLTLAQHYLDDGTPQIALQYAKKALTLDKKNETATHIFNDAEFYVKPPYTEISTPAPKKVENSGKQAAVNETNLSVYELIQKSKTAYENEEWFDAHYYASLAVNTADTTDVNYLLAKETAAVAWDKLNAAKKEALSDTNKYFIRKLDAYNKLQSGDFMGSYYIYNSLKNDRPENARDPDIVKYLEIARKRLLEQYFFIDETFELQKFESVENMYFSFEAGNGGYNVMLIDGVTEVEGTGSYVLYIRGAQLYSFDKYGDFLYSMKVPYAKISALDTKSVSPDIKDEFGIDDKVKTVPYVMLCSVDRDKDGVIMEPVYQYKENYVSEGEGNFLLLPIPYEDFLLLMKSDRDMKNLNPYQLLMMISKADHYGFSREVFCQSLLAKVYYPFLILCIMIFGATMAWNYRLEEGKIFKFIWIFIIPFLNLVCYTLLECANYAVHLLNYFFIGVAGENFAVYAGSVFYIVLLVLVSIGFLSRTGD